jgi:surface protein
MKTTNKIAFIVVTLLLVTQVVAAQFDSSTSTQSATFYLAENGVTVMCPDASVGATGELGGVTYEAVDRNLLLQRRNEGADLTRVCTSLVTNMNSIFEGYSNFNQPIGNWDVSNVTSFSNLFRNARSFNQELNSWDVSKGVHFYGTFAGASTFNSDISDWDVSNGVNLEGMFYEAISFAQDVSKWDVSKATNLSNMFVGNKDFNADISNWNVSNVTTMTFMFWKATSFNQNIGSWNVSKVTNMHRMFDAARSFNQPIGNWNVSQVTDFGGAFSGATSFNADISNWDVRKVTNMGGMFYGASNFNQSLVSWCVKNTASEPSGFSTGSGLSAENKPVWGTCPANANYSRDLITKVVEVFNPATGRIWMDRNLGASRPATSSTDTEAYGDLYQWGRGADGHQKRNSSTTLTLGLTETPDHGSFIVVPNSPFDWLSNQNNNLWQGVNGVNNPCPVGYRIPTSAEWEAERQSWGNNYASGAINSPLKLPTAGLRFGSNGSLNLVGSFGVYWSSAVYYLQAENLDFYSSDANMFARNRADGQSVRCTKDLDLATLPSVITAQPESITSRSVVSGGAITDDGGGMITESGFVWSKSTNPTLSANDGSQKANLKAVGSFEVSLSDLAPSTTYFIRAYATSAVGTSYGESLSFTTLLENEGLLSDQSLIAYYPFNGDANDASQNGNNGTVIGAELSEDRFGTQEAAYEFRGSNSYINLPENLFGGVINNNFTINLWVWFSPIHTGNGVIWNKGGSYKESSLEINEHGIITFGYLEGDYRTSTSVSSISPIKYESWNMVTVTLKPGELSLYLNGELTSQVQADRNFNWSTSINSPCAGQGHTFGRMFNGCTINRGFDGKIDDILFLDRTISADEVVNLYQSQKSQTTILDSDFIFTAPITTSNSRQNEVQMVFGIAKDATDNFDEAFDQLAPPTPPSGTFDARFSHLSEDYYKDFRPIPETETVWTLKVSSGGALPIRITWDPATFPSAGSILLKDAINGSFINVDMRALSFIDVTQDFLTQFIITYKVNQEVELSLIDRWNLIGLPVSVTHDSYQTLFPGALSRSLYSYSEVYELQETLEPGKGYWIRMNEAGSTTLRGAPIESLNLELQTGWNLISGPSESVAVSSIEDSDEIIISGSIFGFNGSYVNATTIEPGRGYWVRTNQAGTITLRGGAASKSTQSSPSLALSGFDRIEFLYGSEQKPVSTLYLNGTIPNPYSAINFELPPVPPAGNVDVRWEDGLYVSESSKAVALVQQSLTPLMFKVPELSADEAQSGSNTRLVSIREFIGDQLINEVQIQRGELFTLSGQTNRIEFELQEKTDLPNEFTLDQNYPNPFNPTTTIRFGLPESADVSLEVYTVLGQKVMTLVNENRSAGWHTVTLNATDLSSGVYVYRIQAGGMVQTKKLMLVK